MEYKRNSGRPKPVIEKELKGLTEKQQLTIQERVEVRKRLKEDLQWIEELNDLGKFSSEWVHKVAVELLFQCMGKKEVLTGFRGKERLVRVFNEKSALEALSMIAKMNGHLFDTIKGNVKQTGTIDHKHQVQIELTPDSNRTESVLNILADCGAIIPQAKRLTKEDVEIISA